MSQLIDFVRDLFSSGGFMPHGHCYLWNPGILWLHILSDALIAAAYFSIPCTLVYFIRKRKDLPFNWIFLCFAIFIIACGTTHLMEIWVIWHPTYWLSGAVKALTALASVPTAILLVKLVPQALALPTEAAARVALRTQQVIAYESGVADTADPLAGSYAIEQLTSEIEDRANEYLKKIDAMGGMLRAIETGYVQKEIQESAYRYQRAVEAREEIVVGVNKFAMDEEQQLSTLRIDPSLEHAQVEKLRALRARRNGEQTEQALAKLEAAATTDENLLPHILDAVESLATVGEISNRLRKVWGEYKETSTI